MSGDSDDTVSFWDFASAPATSWRTRKLPPFPRRKFRPDYRQRFPERVEPALGLTELE
jgi:hypothetical protein